MRRKKGGIERGRIAAISEEDPNDLVSKFRQIAAGIFGSRICVYQLLIIKVPSGSNQWQEVNISPFVGSFRDGTERLINDYGNTGSDDQEVPPYAIA